jgi:hypothetical protein
MMPLAPPRDDQLELAAFRDAMRDILESEGRVELFLDEEAELNGEWDAAAHASA